MCYSVAALLVCLVSLLPAHSQELPARTDVNAILHQVMQKYHLPGMAAVTVRSGLIGETGAVGVRKVVSPDRITPDDHFHLGSNTKAMTATLIGMLVEEGKLSWKSRPLDVFPDLKDSIDSAYKDITLADLLTHRAGIAPFTDGGSADFLEARASKLVSGSPLQQRRGFLQWVLQRKPFVPPQTKTLYSNAGYSLAAAMAEQIAGDSWESMIEQKLFKPLGIRGGFGWPALKDALQPWGHWLRNEQYVPHDPKGQYHLVEFLSPGGATRMSLGDYGRFLQMHLQGLAGKDTLLKAGTFRFLHIPIDNYAFGWGVRTENDLEVHAHSGSAGTFYVTVQLWPSLDLAISVAANAADPNAAKACREAIQSLRELIVKSPGTKARNN